MKRLVAGPQISLHDLILAKRSYSKKSNRNNNACNQMKRFVAGSQISLHDHIRLHFLNPKRLLSVALLTCATTLSSLPEISGVVHQWSRHIVVFFAVMGGGVEAFRQDREAVDHQRQLSHVHSGPFFFLKNPKGQKNGHHPAFSWCGGDVAGCGGPAPHHLSHDSWPGCRLGCKALDSRSHPLPLFQWRFISRGTVAQRLLMLATSIARGSVHRLMLLSKNMT